MIMRKELLQEYTIRVTQSNRSQLVVLIYEIILEYIKDSRQALNDKKMPEFKKALRKVQQLIQELVAALDFQYDLSKQLLSLYSYANRLVTRAMFEKKADRLSEVEMMIEKLHQAFLEVAKQDFSPSLMTNTQPVYAGLTYGKEMNLNVYQEQGKNRGFQA